jgi:chorismate mutase
MFLHAKMVVLNWLLQLLSRRAGVALQIARAAAVSKVYVAPRKYQS